ncbi:MAG TPA: hypothetical protein PKE12_11935 [Kiritimatiellia bacterium]|nr:hypothetical protein [Kiritimatiellia bacterium]
MKPPPTLAEREEEKRSRCISIDDRWRMIQSAINWADAQSAVPRNSRFACKDKERRILPSLPGAH